MYIFKTLHNWACLLKTVSLFYVLLIYQKIPMGRKYEAFGYLWYNIYIIAINVLLLTERPRLPMTEPSLRELTPESVQLSWRPAELPAYSRMRTPIHYKVEMAEMPSSNWVPVARNLPDTSYNVTGTYLCTDIFPLMDKTLKQHQTIIFLSIIK